MPRQLTTFRRFLIRLWRFRLHEWTVPPFTRRGFRRPTSSRRVRTQPSPHSADGRRRRNGRSSRSGAIRAAIVQEQAAQRDELLAKTADEISRVAEDATQRRSATAAQSRRSSKSRGSSPNRGREPAAAHGCSRSGREQATDCGEPAEQTGFGSSTSSNSGGSGSGSGGSNGSGGNGSGG